MRKRIGNITVIIAALLIMLVSAPALFAAGGQEQAASSAADDGSMAKNSTADTGVGKDSMSNMEWKGDVAVFAGGCFWGVEAVFEHLEGVENVASGYSGGDAETAKYNIVGTGATGHAESVRIEYDPEIIDYRTLLEVFFTVAHDPTQLNYQGPDVGSEYRSVVFYNGEEQKNITEAVIQELESKGMYEDPVVTEVVPLEAFYPAEDYHQNFMSNNPQHPYIVYWDAPKIEHLKEAYPELVKDMM